MRTSVVIRKYSSETVNLSLWISCLKTISNGNFRFQSLIETLLKRMILSDIMCRKPACLTTLSPCLPPHKAACRKPDCLLPQLPQLPQSYHNNCHKIATKWTTKLPQLPQTYQKIATNGPQIATTTTNVPKDCHKRTTSVPHDCLNQFSWWRRGIMQWLVHS